VSGTFGSGEKGLRGFAAVAAVVLVEGQAVLPGPRHHLGVGLQLLGAGQGLGSVDPPGVRVRHVQLSAHRIGRQVIPVCRVVTALDNDSVIYAKHFGLFSSNNAAK